jgi:hypothetical protein
LVCLSSQSLTSSSSQTMHGVLSRQPFPVSIRMASDATTKTNNGNNCFDRVFITSAFYAAGVRRQVEFRLDAGCFPGRKWAVGRALLPVANAQTGKSARPTNASVIHCLVLSWRPIVSHGCVVMGGRGCGWPDVHRPRVQKSICPRHTTISATLLPKFESSRKA